MSNGVTTSGCSITATGLQFNGEPTREQWEAAGKMLASAERGMMWCIGDWLLAGEASGYVERGRHREACERFGIAYNTAMQAARVCRAFPESCVRTQHLTFEHHRIVANRPDAPELLEWAADAGATVKELREQKRAVDATETDDELPEAAVDESADLPTGRVIHGDNREVLKTIPDDSIHLVVTSPPYDDLRTYDGHQWDFHATAGELLRVLVDGGVIVWVVGDQTVDGNETGNSFRQAIYFQSIGLRLHDTMIWRKSNPIPQNHNRYEQEFEYMFVFSKGKPRAWNPLKTESKLGGQPVEWGKRRGVADNASRRGRDHSDVRIAAAEKLRGNVWTYPVGGGGIAHPAVFPLALAKDHIESWSNPGDVVLDPFAGSFTTCRAASDLCRKWIGIESNADYCKLGKTRMAQKGLAENGD